MPVISTFFGIVIRMFYQEHRRMRRISCASFLEAGAVSWPNGADIARKPSTTPRGSKKRPTSAMKLTREGPSKKQTRSPDAVGLPSFGEPPFFGKVFPVTFGLHCR
jgi:hypothetical protein